MSKNSIWYCTEVSLGKRSGTGPLAGTESKLPTVDSLREVRRRLFSHYLNAKAEKIKNLFFIYCKVLILAITDRLYYK
jgi:hypothetical protein